jgi:hypothetical protein
MHSSAHCCTSKLTSQGRQMDGRSLPLRLSQTDDAENPATVQTLESDADGPRQQDVRRPALT